jgi:predicted RNase H-like nuclease
VIKSRNAEKFSDALEIRDSRCCAGKAVRHAHAEQEWVAGVDGFKSKWCLILLHLGSGELRARIVPTFASLLELPECPRVICVDIPIGLPEFTPTGGRACEKQARSVLGRKASSVFSALGRSCLKGSSRIEADRLNREGGRVGVAAQAWGLSVEIAGGRCLPAECQQTIYEVHAEVSFWAMKGKTPMLRSKKTAEGAKERVDALVHQGGFPTVLSRDCLLV